MEKWDLRKLEKTKADSLGEKQLEKYGEEEGEPVTEERIHRFRVREEEVACNASALAMTDEAH